MQRGNELERLQLSNQRKDTSLKYGGVCGGVSIEPVAGIVLYEAWDER